MVELRDNVYFAFKCPSCQRALYIPASMGGTKGPCPACRESIEGPRLIEGPRAGELGEADVAAGPTVIDVNSGYGETSPSAGISVEDGDWGGVPDGRPKVETTVLEARVGVKEQDIRRFQARHRIEVPEDVQPDESWRDRHREMQEDCRKRKKREQLAQKLRSKKVGILLVLFFCLAMGYVIYRNYVVGVEEAVRLEALEAVRLEEAAQEDMVAGLSDVLRR
jgi:hypothetical protein